MYTIIMNDDKSLTTSVRTTLYQHENLADQIQFLFPQTCGLVNLNECKATLVYIDQGNVEHEEILAKDSDLYKGKIRFILPVDSKLNYFAGSVVIRLVFEKENNDKNLKEIMKTGETIITILPSGVVRDKDIFTRNSNCDCEDGVPTVDFNNMSSDSSNIDTDKEEDNVVEF